MNRHLRTAITALALVGCLGCGRHHEIQGQVVFAGGATLGSTENAPIAIEFWPVENASSPSAHAIVREDGTFAVTLPDGGTWKTVILQADQVDSDAPVPVANPIPARYSAPATTPLILEAPAKNELLTLELEL